MNAVLPLSPDVTASPGIAPDDFDRLSNELLDYVSKSRFAITTTKSWASRCCRRISIPSITIHTSTSSWAVSRASRRFAWMTFRNSSCARMTRGAMTVRATGGSEVDLEKRIDAELSRRLPDGKSDKPQLPRVGMPKKVELTIVQKPQAIATAISLGFPLTLNRSDDDYYALRVAESAFGEHRCMVELCVIWSRGVRSTTVTTRTSRTSSRKVLSRVLRRRTSLGVNSIFPSGFGRCA